MDAKHVRLLALPEYLGEQSTGRLVREARRLGRGGVTDRDNR